MKAEQDAADLRAGRALRQCFVETDLDEPLEIAVAYVSDEWRAVLRYRLRETVIETGYGPDRPSALESLAERLKTAP